MRKTTKSVIAAVAAVAVVAGAFAACSSNKNNAQGGSSSLGQITVISREEGSGTRDAFTELAGIVDENKTDQTTDTAEITNSTSVMMSTVSGNEKAIG